jgi:hypothetical protein
MYYLQNSRHKNFLPLINTITDIAGKVDILRQGGDIKKKNPWVEHVQKFAKESNISYFKALSNPKFKSTYKKGYNK